MCRWALLAVFICLVPGLIWAEDKYDAHWLLTFKGEATDALVGDKRFKDLMSLAVPDFDVDLGFGPHGIKTGLKNSLMEVLSGPSDPIIMLDNHMVAFSACRSENCGEKGFMWVDVNNAQSVFAIIHFVYAGSYSDKPQLFLASNDFQCGLYPEAAVGQIKFWLKQNQITPATVRCLDGHKVSETIL